MPSGVLTLTRAQRLAFQLARKESVVVSGGPYSGKTLLASALAVQAANSGLECLLVGASRQLDRPIAFKMPNGCPMLLLRRAQQGSPNSPASSDRIAARARITPEALRDAQAILHRALQIRNRHPLSPEDLDLLHPLSPEAADLIAVTMEDAGQIADALWSGNRRAGRSISEVMTVLSGGTTEIPPDENRAFLMSADDETFETGFRHVPNRDPDEVAFAAVLAGLHDTAPGECTIIEVFRQIGRVCQALGDAANLARTHSLKDAIATKSGDDGVKVLEVLARNHPELDVKATVGTLERACGYCELDAKALSPYLPRFGFRTVRSFAAGETLTTKHAVPMEVAKTIWMARSSARQLPGLLSRLQRVLSEELVTKIVGGPIEDALSSMTAAAELRELRKLFADTGFGDLCSTPETFLEFRASSQPQAALPTYERERGVTTA